MYKNKFHQRSHDKKQTAEPNQLQAIKVHTKQSMYKIWPLNSTVYKTNEHTQKIYKQYAIKQVKSITKFNKTPHNEMK